MFTYCNNDPIVHCDESGTRFNDANHDKFNTMLYGANNSAIIYVYFPKPKLWETGSIAAGVSGSAYCGYGGSFSCGVAIDSFGDASVVVTTSGGAGTLSSGICGFFTYSTADTLSDLEGRSEYAGASVSILVATIGLDYTISNDSETNEAYHSFTLYIGSPSLIPFETHGGVAKTWRIINPLRSLFK